MSATPQSWDHPSLRPYLKEVAARHGRIRFLGLPALRDAPDLPIEWLFVPPALAERPIAPEQAPAEWPPTRDVLGLLLERPRLVVLGDPGSGKSTLVDWLAWRLAVGLATPLPGALEGLLPLPLVLRELDLSAVADTAGLLGAFLAHPLGRLLTTAEARTALDALLAAGRVLFLLDGLDEIAAEARERIRAAVHGAWEHGPDNRWLLTARAVGYDACPFDVRTASAGADASTERQRRQRGRLRAATTREGLLGPYPDPVALQAGDDLRTYVAPFDDTRLNAFASNWYRLRDPSQSRAGDDAERFLAALRNDPAILHLARTPHLLTLMAAVFRTELHLPNGRALLYAKIAEAYLDTLDRAKGVAASPALAAYTAEDKQRWLARVAFELQCRRGDDETDQALLASASEVLNWIAQAMAASARPPSAAAAREYLGFVEQRSGLLLARGPDRYAFLHLSFQEYFAAHYLKEQVESPEWVIDGQGEDARANRGNLAAWADQSAWHETFVFLYELLPPRWNKLLFEVQFGKDADAIVSAIESDSDTLRRRLCSGREALLPRLVADPHANLSTALREAGRVACCRLLAQRGWSANAARLLGPLLRDPAEAERTWSALAALRPTVLALHGVPLATLDDLVARFTELSGLSLGLASMDDPGPLRRLPKLKHLIVFDARNEHLRTLGTLNRLESLSLVGDNSMRDLEPLSALRGLRELDLLGIGASDLTPLRTLQRLRVLGLGASTVADLGPLRALRALEAVDLWLTLVVDLGPLHDLPRLRRLKLEETQVAELGPLAERAARGELEIVTDKPELQAQVVAARRRLGLPDPPAG